MDALIASLANDPRYVWVAVIVALTPTLKWLFNVLPTIWKNIKPHENNIEKMAESERKASEAMKKIADEYGIDRACISLFHNGTRSLSNIHFLKVSVLAEGLSGRVGSIISQSQNRNLAEYGDLGSRLIIDHDSISIPDISAIKESHSGMHLLLELNLVKSIHIMPIFDRRAGRKKRVDGCVFVEHCVHNTELTIEQMDDIQARAQEVYNELYLVNNGS